jgi:hypothetical protein
MIDIDEVFVFGKMLAAFDGIHLTSTLWKRKTQFLKKNNLTSKFFYFFFYEILNILKKTVINLTILILSNF